ncbi:unnamed protein product [Acanthoscelides obtectus]|uniref:Uncharacterized protein n=1 Tax=Acanthoscelides obtectus TaxID=200917 RepID=A0A9P0PCF0_ACAOB|nr:unnamed protein product [Acanthoscelides obtectus]CAK1623693.1 hypothetical protein AOBTE_LOCUS2122 [Acanthoscelides obtectus]
MDTMGPMSKGPWGQLIWQHRKKKGLLWRKNFCKHSRSKWHIHNTYVYIYISYMIRLWYRQIYGMKRCCIGTYSDFQHSFFPVIIL